MKIGDTPMWCWPNDNQMDLDGCIQEIFDEAFRVLELKSGGSVQDDIDLATKNLIKMYELDAPNFLLRKAHSVQRRRLSNLRASMRSKRELARESAPNERGQQFTLIEGGKLAKT
jgi:hypothetical protein